MKRKVCESLFAVTLALIVAVTNIPVTAFATEINQSARQEQTTESVQTENQGQQSDGLQENHEAQNETNSENGQNSTDNPAGAGQNSGEGDNPAGTDLKKDNLFEGNNFQKADNQENSGVAEEISRQQNTDDNQQNAQVSEQAAMLSSDETQWNWHKGEITQNELKKLLGDSWPYVGTYRWSKDRENWNKTSVYGNPVYTFDTGTYYFQKETVTWADIQWNDIGTKEIHAYYNMEINIYGSSEGVVYNSENLAVPLNSTFQVYDNKYKFTVKNIENYEIKVTATGGSQGERKLTPDANGMYEVIFDDDVTVKVEYIATNYVNVKIEQTENAAVYINGTLTETEDTRVNLNENFQIKIVPQKGYAIEGVTVDQASVSDLSFEKYAASFSWYSGETNQATITISPKVVKEVLALKENETVSYHKGMNVERLKNNIFNSVIDKENTVPSNISMDDVTIQYNNGVAWKELDYQPGVLEFYAHAFGSKDTEKVRITYKGNSQYAPFSETVTVNLSDERIETQVVIQEGITIRYNTEDVMKQELLQHITVQDKDGNTLPVDKSELTLSYDRTVGQQEMTVSYVGDDDYKDSAATAIITITKGDATVSVNSQKITYGESFETPIFTASPEEAKAIGLIVGITASGEKYASIDLSLSLIHI